MALSDSFLHSLIDKHKDEYQKITVDKKNVSTWYIGFNQKYNARNSDKTWLIYLLSNTGTTVDITSCGDNFSCSFDDILTLNFLPLSSLVLAGSLELDSTKVIGDEIGVLSNTGGDSPFVYSIETDADDKFQIAGNKLQYKNTVLSKGAHSVTIKITDNGGATSTKEFNFTVVSSFSITKSLSLDGVNESLSAPVTTDHTLAFTTGITILARIKVPTVIGLGTRCILSNVHQNGASGGYYLYLDTTGKIYAKWRGTIGNATIGNGAKPTAETWHNLIVKGNQVSSEMWLDGVEILTGGLPINGELLPDTTGEGVKVGIQRVGFYPFEGQIKEIATYNKSLTNTQCAAISVAGFDIKTDDSYADIVYHYKLGETFTDEGGGNFKVVDEVNGHDLTASNMDLTNIVEDAPV